MANPFFYFFFFFFDNEEEFTKYTHDIEINSRKYVAKTLRVLRYFHKKSLKEIAEKTKIPYQTISRYEHEENEPTINQAIKLANYYKLGLDELIYFGSIEDEDELIEKYKEYLELSKDKAPLDKFAK